MILVDTTKNDFSVYIDSLSAHAKKDYRYVQKHNKDLTYQIVPFLQEEVQKFMYLWEQQPIRGIRRQWAFPVEYVTNLVRTNKLKLFAAQLGEEKVAMHFIEEREGFWECHPPMYDKGFGNKRYLAKYMWFNLIRYACENNLGFLDLGSVVNNWHEMIKNRDQFPNAHYKWIYIPEDVKNNPRDYPNYEIANYANTKWLREINGL